MMVGEQGNTGFFRTFDPATDTKLTQNWIHKWARDSYGLVLADEETDWLRREVFNRREDAMTMPEDELDRLMNEIGEEDAYGRLFEPEEATAADNDPMLLVIDEEQDADERLAEALEGLAEAGAWGEVLEMCEKIDAAEDKSSFR